MAAGVGLLAVREGLEDVLVSGTKDGVASGLPLLCRNTKGHADEIMNRTIHCCWFGGKKTALAQKCRASWAAWCPDWTIREWNEENVGELAEIPGFDFFQAAATAKKWAAASDWVRMAALWKEGGVYLDYDVELVRSPDGLCRDGEWVSSEWTVDGGVQVNPGGGIALEAQSPIAAFMLNAYAMTEFDARREMMPFIVGNLAAASQKCVGLRVLLPEVMNPIDVRGVCHRTDQTVGIHHYAMSWASPQRQVAKWLSWHGMRGVVEFLLKIKRGLK